MQEQHGDTGESRTKDILLNRFSVAKPIPDKGGRDFLVELPTEHYDYIEGAVAYVQAKFFQDNNEVILKKEYLFEKGMDLLRKNFFVFVHTGDFLNRNYYFFSAREVTESWKFSKRKKGDFYVFKLKKRKPNHFDSYKNKDIQSVLDEIEKGIIENNDSKENRLRRRFIKEQHQQNKIYHQSDNELFTSIKNRHILDKFDIVLNKFNNFRRIISWRLVRKVSFSEDTYYSGFTLNTRNKDIITFFDSLEIESEIEVLDESFFKGVNEVNEKLNRVVNILNQNLVFNVNDKSIYKSSNNCNCLDSQFERLNFREVYSSITKNDEVLGDLWQWMEKAYILSRLKKYHESAVLFQKIGEKAKLNNEPVIQFISDYNRYITSIWSWKTPEEVLKPNIIDYELSSEEEIILNSVLDNSLINSYKNTVDELYLKILEYKQSNFINDTSYAIKKLRIKTAEYLNFFQGNYFANVNADENKIIIEKYIEASIVSYSMNTPFSCHLKGIDDYLIKLILLNCSSSKLLNAFQRNQVKKMPYYPTSDYFEKAVNNFFSKENVDFLEKETNYINGRTNNPDLRRSIIRTYENIFTLLAYVDFDFDTSGLLNRITYFIEKLDFNIYENSSLTFPLLNKPHIFSVNEILKLISVLLSNNKYKKGHLLTNSLWALNELNYTLNSSNDELNNKLIISAIEDYNNGILKVLKIVFSKEYVKDLQEEIFKSLKDKFNRELYYEAVISNTINSPDLFIEDFLILYKTHNDLKPKYSMWKSPYSGIEDPYWRIMKRLIDIIYTLEKKSLINHPIVQEISSLNPYYHFLINIDEFKEGHDFDKNWILDNQSEIVMKKLSTNSALKSVLKHELENKFDSQLAKIFVKYFN